MDIFNSGDPWPGEFTSSFLEFPDRECVEACERNGFAATQMTTYVREPDVNCYVSAVSVSGNNQQIASFKVYSVYLTFNSLGMYICLSIHFMNL